MNARLNVSIFAKIVLFISQYKFFKNDSNGHGFYFKFFYYSNIWIIHVQWPTNLPKSMWKLAFNVVDVIFEFGNFKSKTHKVIRTITHLRLSKTYFLKQFFWKRNKNCNSYGLMKIWSNFKHSKSLTIKWLRFSNKIFLVWIYHLVLHHKLSPNNKFGMWINIILFFLWWSS